MDQFNRLLAWSAYVVGGVIVGLWAYVAFQHYRLNHAERAVQLADARAGQQSPAAAPVQVIRGAQLDQVYSQQEHIKRLQTLLKQKTELLDKKTELLDEKIAEQQRLQAELDETIELFEMLAAEMVGDGSGGPRRTGDPTVREELQRLKADAEKNRRLAEERQREMESLVLELTETDEEIDFIAAESEMQFTALLAEKQAFESAVTSVLGRVGQPAVGVLEDQLGHRRADVRQWAATMLGEIGPEAAEALPSLAEVVTDPDEGVRNAAKQALEQIAPASE